MKKTILIIALILVPSIVSAQYQDNNRRNNGVYVPGLDLSNFDASVGRQGTVYEQRQKIKQETNVLRNIQRQQRLQIEKQRLENQLLRRKLQNFRSAPSINDSINHPKRRKD